MWLPNRSNRRILPPLLSLKASVSDPDTLSYEQAVKDKDKSKWIEAAQAEIDGLTSNGTWVEVPTSEAKTRIVPGTWVFKRKRSPDGTIKKYKARYCVRGDLVEGEFDTFAPVVSWSTIRIVLIISVVLGWELVCVDFAQAFVQADLEEPVWIHLPTGFKSD